MPEHCDKEKTLTLPTQNEIREAIDRSGCDVLAFFRSEADADPKPDDQCFLHSISHRDVELLAVDIRREDAPAVSGLVTNLVNHWETKPVKAGDTCLAKGCNLMLSVVEPPGKLLNEIMDKALRAAVAYRGNKDFSVLVLVPARRLTDTEIEEVTAIS